jgi:hypothetical protein
VRRVEVTRCPFVCGFVWIKFNSSNLKLEEMWGVEGKEGSVLVWRPGQRQIRQRQERSGGGGLCRTSNLRGPLASQIYGASLEAGWNIQKGNIVLPIRRFG